jgi:fructose-specific phosphotransferase system IIC component
MALAMAPLVIFGGVCLAISFLALILLPLYDLWLRKTV